MAIYDSSNSSKYMVFADEAGDHNLESWNIYFPVFVLAFCIIEKSHYCDFILPSINKLKLKYFNRTDIILHERDIRKQQGVFSCLFDKDLKNLFMNDLTQIMASSQFTVVSSVINKPSFKEKYRDPVHPYHLATSFCLERLKYFLSENNELKHTNITFEARGNKEDNDLREAFTDYCKECDISMNIIPKANNCVGLQFADLIARPIGRYVINPEQTNRSFDIIKNKFRVDSNGDFKGRGLKIFP